MRLSRMRNRVLFTVAAAWSLACSSCGGPEGLHPVYGKVLYKGEPAAGATVYFHREGGIDPAKPVIPSGVVDEEGNYSLSTLDVGRGAPAGKYAVLVMWPRDEDESPSSTPAP